MNYTEKIFWICSGLFGSVLILFTIYHHAITLDSYVTLKVTLHVRDFITIKLKLKNTCVVWQMLRVSLGVPVSWSKQVLAASQQEWKPFLPQ